MAKQKKGKSLLKITLCVLVGCAVVGIAIAAIMFLNNPGRTAASASIEFSFDGAANGKAPNGYTFDLSGITDTGVLQAALESAGMSGRYTAAQIREHLNARGVYPENIIDQLLQYDSTLDFSGSRSVVATDYHPTKYAVILYNDFDKDISKADLQKLLECILTEYKAYFAKTYAVGTNDIELSYTLEDYDYSQQLAILNQAIKSSADYAAEMYEKKPGFTFNGQGFNGIASRLNSLINSDISKLSANVTYNALSKDQDRLVQQYEYEISILNSRLEQKNAQLKRLDALINAYKKNEIIYLTTANTLTRIDGNSTKIYDMLISAKSRISKEISDIKSEIAKHQLPLDILKGTEKSGTVASGAETEDAAETAQVQDTAEDTAARTAALEAGIEALKTKRENIMTEFAAMIKTYNDQQINDQTMTVSEVKYSAPKLLSGAFAKQCVKVAGPICVVGFMVCLVIIIVTKRKEEKDQ